MSTSIPSLPRRDFLRASAGAAALALTPRSVSGARSAGPAFSFVLLGDLHYDKPEHHDFAWLDRTHPGDLSQIRNYSRVTREITPRHFETVRATVSRLNQDPGTRVAFVLQAGDLVEGLCGNAELAGRQNAEAVAFIRESRLGAPFLFTKGNHDITGDGAREAFAGVFHPFLTDQVRALATAAPEVRNARYTVEVGRSQFAFFDAYDSNASLEWLEAVAARRTADHLFVVVHPPVVPYGARSTWHLFSAEREKARRAKLLEILGRQHAIVLGGHIHRYNTLSREAGGGRFAQFALSSVINAPAVTPKTQLQGVDDYTGDQIRVEPAHSPATEKERRAVYDTERPFVKAFEYADLPGYAVVTVDGANVTARMYSGLSRDLWRTVNLASLAQGG
ncbi:MAG: metallophosphoesterase family protein [Opitutaceae bacterium]